MIWKSNPASWSHSFSLLVSVLPTTHGGRLGFVKSKSADAMCVRCLKCGHCRRAIEDFTRFGVLRVIETNQSWNHYVIDFFFFKIKLPLLPYSIDSASDSASRSTLSRVESSTNAHPSSFAIWNAEYRTDMFKQMKLPFSRQLFLRKCGLVRWQGRA